MPIEGLTNVKRLTRIGKIRLGIKKTSQTGKEYPSATEYFVCPPEVQKVYGKEPKRLDVIIPVEDDEIWASQYYRQYSKTRGLVCKGDGITCRRMVDTKTGDTAGRTTKTVKWEEGGVCAGRDCPDYQKRDCQEVMNLQVLLPKVPGLGIWQIDTGSIHSIRNINDCATTVRATCEGRVSWIPLVLTLEPTEVVSPDDGKKKTVYCLHLFYEKSLLEILESSSKPRTQLLIAPPVDNEAPEDRQLGTGKPEHIEELQGQVEDDIDTLWPAKSAESPTPAPASPVEHKEAGEEMTEENGVNWILNSMKTLKWGFKDAIGWMVGKNLIPAGEYPKFSQALSALSEDGMKAFVKEIRDRLAMSKPHQA